MTNVYVNNAVAEFVKFPVAVGYWVLYPGAAQTTKFAMYHRPTDEQIKNTEQLLGCGWEDVSVKDSK